MNKRFSPKKSLILATTLLTLMSGCAQVSNNISADKVTVNTTGLVQDKSKKPTLVYTRPGAPTLADYSKFIIDPVIVDYSDPSINDISTEDINEMRNYFHKVMTTSLTDAGYQVVTRTAENTLRVSFKISDLKAPTAATNVSMLLVPGLSTSVGEVTVEATFTDAASGTINAVVLENSRGSYMFNPNPLTTLSDVEAAFDNWAAGFTQAINKAHNK